MADSYSVKAILSAVDKNFTSTFRKAESVADGLTNKIKSGLGFGVLTGIGQQAFSSITSGVSGMVGELNSSSKAWKTFEGNLKILNSSSKDIQDAKVEMQDFATKTIYSASDMASTYAQLASVGTKECDRLVTGFGGLAAAAENPKQAMKTLSTQATQMAARPMVQWMDFKLMLEQTPAGMAAVAKEMGRTSAQLVSDIQEGTVTTEEFFDAIKKVGNSDGFQQLATQYKSVDEAMDGLQETLAVKLAPAFASVSKIGINAIEGLISKLESEKFSTIFDSLGTNIANTFNTVGKVISNVWRSFSDTGAIKGAVEAFNSFRSAVDNVVTSIMNCGIIEDLVTIFGKLTAQISKVIKYVSDFVANLDPGVIETFAKSIVGLVVAYKGLKIINSAVSKVKTFNSACKSLFKKPTKKLPIEDALEQLNLKNASEEINSKFKGISQVVESVGTSIKSVFEGVAETIRSFGTAISTAVQGIGTGLANAFRGLGSAIAMVPPTTWLALSVAILAVGAAFALAGSQGEGLKAILQGVGIVIASMLPIVQVVVDGIVSTVQMLPDIFVSVGEAISVALQGVADVVVSLGKAIGTVVTSVADGMATITSAIGDAISGVLNSLAGIIDSIGNAALNAGKGFNQLANGIVKITKLNLFDMGASLGAVATGLLAIGASSMGISSVANGLTKMIAALTMIQTVNAMVGTSFTSMTAISNNSMSLLENAVSKASSQIQKEFKQMGAEANTGFKSGLSKMPSTAQSMIRSVVSSLNKGKSQAYKSGSYMSQGFAQGMLSQLSLITSAANQIVAQADRAIRAKAQIHSPSRLTNKLGSYFGEGFGNGIYSMAGYVKRASNDLFEIPQMGISTMTMSYSKELSDDFEYSRNATYTIVVPVELDGREIAKVTAPYTEDELNKRSRHDNRKHGRI